MKPVNTNRSVMDQSAPVCRKLSHLPIVNATQLANSAGHSNNLCVCRSRIVRLQTISLLGFPKPDTMMPALRYAHAIMCTFVLVWHVDKTFRPGVTLNSRLSFAVNWTHDVCTHTSHCRPHLVLCAKFVVLPLRHVATLPQQPQLLVRHVVALAPYPARTRTPSAQILFKHMRECGGSYDGRYAQETISTAKKSERRPVLYAHVQPAPL